MTAVTEKRKVVAAIEGVAVVVVAAAAAVGVAIGVDTARVIDMC